MKNFVIASIVILVFVDVSLNLNFTIDENGARQGKAFSLFQVVRFQNGPCQSATRNGTCYTASECQVRNGVASGTCAGGFGVCCIFILGCGQTTRDNCTYLSRTTVMAETNCAYTVCKTCDTVCRIRFDFRSFDLAQPVLGLTETVATMAALSNNGGAIGDCTTDRFSITSPGNVAPPQICGFNTGQHMIVDASDRCHVASFNLGRTSSTYDIKVTQYLCGQEMGGPDGCLQYFTGNTGTIASYNFPTQSALVPLGTTHLSNQCYTMCFRQEMGKCAICYQVATMGVVGVGQGSFGLSATQEVIATGENEKDCSSDYLMIPGARRDSPILGSPMFVVGVTPVITVFNSRICGRFFHLALVRNSRTDNTESICSSQKPFRISFKTDADEKTLAATNDAELNEQSVAPGGIIGFNLNWALQDC
ncbi:uncharacterized protein LOC131884423 [Tigriopus californicus]|uniref:uncharacterized protein LOC131884423 n=1 Tax=Tigriopus californicus TaxID=6832 RepID=UPI0027DA6AFA|nr:uncharacterized protein LOC131884423 [Tigriopus californicus]